MAFTRNHISYVSDDEIDGTATGTHDLFTTNDNGVPLNVYQGFNYTIEEENVLTPGVISIGTNDPDYNNIVSMKSIGGELGLGLLELVNSIDPIPPNTLVKVKINTACTPVLFQTPTLNFKPGLFGTDVEL